MESTAAVVRERSLALHSLSNTDTPCDSGRPWWPNSISKRCDRVDWRAGPVRNRQRRDGQHELPSVARRGRFAQCVEVAAVEEVDAEDRQREIVNGQPREIAGRLRNVARRFPSEQRDVALLQPRDDRIVEARRPFI